MSKARIERTIPQAIEVLERYFPDGVIPSAYNGYIAAFGASVVQSGLKATLALFENTNASTVGDRSCLTKIILEILDPDHGLQANEAHREGGCPGASLLRYVVERPNEERILKEKILDIAVAVKLAIRTFKLDKQGG